MAVPRRHPDIQYISVLPIRMFRRTLFHFNHCAPPADMSKSLHNISILLIAGAVLEAAWPAMVSVPIWQFVKEHIRAFIKEPRPESLIPENTQP